MLKQFNNTLIIYKTTSMYGIYSIMVLYKVREKTSRELCNWCRGDKTCSYVVFGLLAYLSLLVEMKSRDSTSLIGYCILEDLGVTKYTQTLKKKFVEDCVVNSILSNNKPFSNDKHNT